jgi:alkylglycerol monooxygenase
LALFEEEKEPVVFGITTPLKSWNPAWANVHYYVDLAQQTKRCTNIADKLHVWVAPPGWQPDYLGGRQYPKPVSVETFEKFDTPASKGLSAYTLVQFSILMLLATAYLAIANKLDLWVSILYAANIFITLASIGALFEKKRWGFVTEFIISAYFLCPGWPFYCLLAAPCGWGLRLVLGPYYRQLACCGCWR